MKKPAFSSGSITIFLTLTLTLILSMLFSTIESARRFAMTSYLEGISRISMDSMFASYCSQLWEDYHVFSLITSEPEFRGNLESYIKKNSNNSFLSATLSDIKINDFSNISGKNGEHFINQVLSYMRYMEVSYIADYFFAESGVEYDASGLVALADGDLSSETFDSLNFGNLYDMVTSSNEALIDESYTLDFSLSDSFSLEALKNITHIFDDTLLYYVVEDTNDLSFATIEIEGYPSSSIDISSEEMLSSYEFYERFLFCEYLLNHFSTYTTETKDIPLKYQTEYLLCGLPSDDDNLLCAVKKLVLLRFGFNVLHILSDKEKTNILSGISKTVTAIPALPLIIQLLLTCLWALSESVIDVRDLLSGKNVPLFKSADDWSLSLDNILTFDYYTESANTDNDGLSYNNYLEMLIINENIHSLAIRALDLIQLDISTNINDTFLISNCIDGVSCEFTYLSNDLFSPVNFHYNSVFAPTYSIMQNYYYQ